MGLFRKKLVRYKKGSHPEALADQPGVSFSVFAPFIGGRGNVDLLDFTESGGKAICRQHPKMTLMYVGIFLFWGPGLLAMIFFNTDKLNDAPWIIWLLAGGVWLAGVVGALNAALRHPRIVIDKADGSLRCYEYFGRQPKYVFRRDEIARVTASEETYRDDNREYPNYILTLAPTQGKPLVLTCTVKKESHDKLISWLSVYTGAALENKH